MIPFISPSWWRQRREDREVHQQAKAALQVTVEAWTYFHETVPFRAGTGIGDKVAAFVPPIMERYKRDFPILVIHTDLAWHTIFTAVCASGTESQEELEELRGALQALLNR